jgi:hypothetical protein
MRGWLTAYLVIPLALIVCQRLSELQAFKTQNIQNLQSTGYRATQLWFRVSNDVSGLTLFIL